MPQEGQPGAESSCCLAPLIFPGRSVGDAVDQAVHPDPAVRWPAWSNDTTCAWVMGESSARAFSRLLRMPPSRAARPGVGLDELLEA